MPRRHVHPLRLTATEGILRGQVPQPDLLRRAEAEAAREIRPISDVRTTEAYRRGVIPALLREALEEALSRARGGKGGRR